MQQVIHIFKKEFKAYFSSPIAYIVIAIFLIATGACWFFFEAFFVYKQATLRGFFSWLPIIFSFVIPAITMRLLSEEMNIGSYETLMTMPVTFTDVILGKFLAAVGFIVVALIPTLAYPISVASIGQLDWGPVFGGYIGAVFLGAAFCAIGLLASSLTRNQIIAFIIGLAICFILTLLHILLFFLPPSLLNVLGYLGTTFHFQNIAKGIIDSRDFVYFLSLCFIGLYGAHLALQGKQ
jgi:ABC-2 type transport system permease protein